jgi:signal transduction histidine kinase
MLRRESGPKTVWQKLKFLAFLASAAAFGIIYIVFLVKSRSSARTLGDWSFQFPLLLLASASLSVPVFFLREGSRAKTSLFLVQVLICLILGYLEGDSLWMELILLMILVIESLTQFRFGQGLAVGIGILAVVIVLQKPVTAWDVPLPGVPASDTAAFGFCVLFFIILISTVRFLAEKYDAAESALSGLHGSVIQLMAANMVFQHYAAAAEDKALVSERNRITREIHDSVGYNLTNLAMMMEASRDLSRREKREELETMLVRARDQVKEAIKDTRATLHLLRTEDAPPAEGLRAVNKLITTFSAATDVRVSVEFGNVPWSFGAEVDAIVYRMVQEGLANAFRHGKATRVSISLWMEDGEVSVQVYDNGVGLAADHSRDGIGIRGMRERVESRGGRIRITGDETGCKLSAWIPVRAESQADELQGDGV